MAKLSGSKRGIVDGKAKGGALVQAGQTMMASKSKNVGDAKY